MTSLGEVYDASQGSIMGLAVLRDDFGLITVSHDRSVRIWLRRSNGQYWPSVCHFLSAPCTTLHVNPDSRHVYVGIETGQVAYYQMSDDLNVLESVRTFNQHANCAVLQCIYCPLREWIFSIGADGTLVWSDVKSGNKLGNYALPSKPRCFQFDSESGFIFYGDESGRIIILRLHPSSTIESIITLERHLGSPIQVLHWDASKQKLYSSGNKTNNIICWDIGGKQGHFVELNGHAKPVGGLFTHRNKLFSFGVDGTQIVWDMNKSREQPPDWAESDSCQACTDPFFWNVKQMWSDKKIGVRQHHCRACGKALCEKCSRNRTTIPRMGFEFNPVRTCLGCYESITQGDRAPYAETAAWPTDIMLMEIDFNVRRMAALNRNKKIFLFDFGSYV